MNKNMSLLSREEMLALIVYRKIGEGAFRDKALFDRVFLTLNKRLQSEP